MTDWEWTAILLLALFFAWKLECIYDTLNDINDKLERE
jgi:hypothetical protein